MTVKLTWLSHGSWLLETAHHRVLLDPFFTDNPAAKQSADAFENISHVLVSHGHFDHVADVALIANRCAATVVANFEIAQWFQSQHGVQAVEMMNIGGAIELPFGTVKMVPAIHSSGLPDGASGGEPAGFVVTLADQQRVYFACDTAIYSDMRLYAQGVDLAVLPIGDRFTMGPEDSIEAIRLIEPKRVAPAHYNTWPPIAQDADAWAARVKSKTSAEPIVLAAGESLEL